MASVQSLGLHEPSALPYLIAESIVPQDPAEDLYRWKCYGVYDRHGAELAEEEVTATSKCVVWSRSGVVKRVFNLDVEGEPILQFFVTQFRSKRGHVASQVKSAHDANSLYTVLPAVTQKSSHKKNLAQDRGGYEGKDTRSATDTERNQKSLERALVVILRSQAHIYLLSGDSHVIPIPFEVEVAFPAPQGFVLQRRLSHANVKSSTPDSKTASLDTSDSMLGDRPSERSGLRGQKSSTPNAISNGPTTLQSATSPAQGRDMPRVFSFTDPHSELGLVVDDTTRSPSTKNGSMGDPQILDTEEEIIYMSHHNEFELGSFSDTSPLILAVSSNDKAGTYTVWHVKYHNEDGPEPLPKRRKTRSSGQSLRRRSSNAFGNTTRTVTPNGRGTRPVRESFGALAQSHSENIAQPFPGDNKSSHVEELAAQLGPDFGDIGVQTRAARRVSSMLARTDLSMGHDRNVFSEIGAGHATRKSLNKSIRRGESLGGFSDRQSFGPRRRSSLPGNSSVFSHGTSFLDAPIDKILEDLHPNIEFDRSESVVLDESIDDMPREIAFSKIETIPYSIEVDNPSDSRCRPKVFTLLSPAKSDSLDSSSQDMSVCIMNKKLKELSVIHLSVSKESVTKRGRGDLHRQFVDSKKRNMKSVIRATDLRKGSNIIDACRVGDNSCSRMLILTQTRDGHGTLHLEAPWSSSVRVDLPSKFMIYNPFSVSPTSSPDRRREGGLKRIIKDPPNELTSLEFPSIRGRVSIVDSQHKRHRIQIQMEPRNQLVKKVLSVCKFVLPRNSGDGLLIAWWEVMRWLGAREYNDQTEWTAIVIVLFSMAVPFIGEKHSQSSLSQRRKKTGLLRSSSGTTIDMSSWEAMVEQEAGVCNPTPSWLADPGWRWIAAESSHNISPSHHGTFHRSKQLLPSSIPLTGRKNPFLLQCASLSREFLQNPAGEASIGPEGYLPTAVNKDRELRRTALGTVLVGLHLLREEEKLDVRLGDSSDTELGQLAPVLAQLGGWIGWEGWSWKKGSYLNVEIVDVDQWLFEDSSISNLDMPGQPFEPPSVFAFAETCFDSSQPPSFLTLLDVLRKDRPVTETSLLWKEAEKITPRTFLLQTLSPQFHNKVSRMSRVESMVERGLTDSLIDTFPDGIAAPLHEAIVSCRANPPASSSEALLELLDRDDMQIGNDSQTLRHPPIKSYAIPSHEAQRDYHAIGHLSMETETFHSWDASSEADRQAIARLIFCDDRRFQEASKLVNQLRPPVVECNTEPEWTESDLLEAQKELVQYVTRRTLAVSSGRGMMNFNARVPLLTEKVPIPAFTLQCIMTPKYNTETSFSSLTFSADRASFTEDKVCWAFFHNGASAGLMISKEARGIDTSWILYNKPPELTNRHAGFLLALGLNGHLKSLAKWVAFKYLTPKHTMTSVGLLLGLSVSYIGTTDTLITRLLSVHVTCLLPPGAAELNLSPLTQTTGLMGIGLLYCSSQHRRMSEVMLSEIENTDPEEGVSEETVLRDEGYRLAAGFSLGLINLGHGKRLHSLHDMSVVERLLSVAIGTKNVNYVHVLDRATAGATIALTLIFMKTNDASIASKIDIPDTVHQFDYVRPDIFLLRTVARHLILWSRITPSAAFIQASLPKPYRHRATLKSTRHLSSEDMPFFNIVAGLCLAIGLRFAGSAKTEVRDLLISYLDHFIRLTRLPALNYDAKLTRNSVRNCQDVIALACSAVMAGTGDIVVFRRLRALHGRTDADTPYGSHLAAHMAVGALFLGGGTHTFGTNNLAVASLLCAFYPLFPTSVLDNRSHLQAFRHLWVLAAEPRCIVPRDVETSRPVSIPIQVTLKARVGAAAAEAETEISLTAPCLLPELADIATIRTAAKEYWDVVVDFTAPPHKGDPTALSALDAFRKNQSVFLRRRAAYDAPASSVFASALQTLADSGPAPSVSSGTAGAITSFSPHHHYPYHRPGGGKNPLEWLWALDALDALDVAERALVLPPTGGYSLGGGTAVAAGRGKGAKFLRGTVVDTRLELEKGILPDDDDDDDGNQHVDHEKQLSSRSSSPRMTRDGLWQLRLLFQWVDELDRLQQQHQQQQQQEVEAGKKSSADAGNNLKPEEGFMHEGDEEVDGSGGEGGGGGAGGTWLRREVVDRLRWRVWKMANADSTAAAAEGN